MKSLFRTEFSTDAVSRFLEKNRRKETILGWIPQFAAPVLYAFFAVVPAGLLFAAINSWFSIKVPLWILLLPCLFVMTLWLEFGNDMDHRTATWRAIFNTLAHLAIAFTMRYFLSTDISDRVLRDGSVAKHSCIVPFWASLLLTWIFMTYAELRWEQANQARQWH